MQTPQTSSRRIVVTVAIVAGLILGSVGVVALARPANAAPLSDQVQLFPPSGSQTANPESTISVRGVSLSAVQQIVVTGSSSGVHPGTWIADSDGQGGSLQLSAPFAQAEAVHVDLALTDGSSVTHDFATATVPTSPAPVGIDPNYPDVSKADLGEPVEAEAQPLTANTIPSGASGSLGSRPDLTIPAINIRTSLPSQSPGVVLSSPQTGSYGTQAGVLIYDSAGEPVWFRPSNQPFVANLEKIQYSGKDALAFFGGQPIGAGAFVGSWPVLDASYTQIGEIKAGNGYQADVHELLVNPDNTAYIVAYPRVTRDLSDWGGLTNATVLDAVIQQIDLPTGNVLFEWHALDHIPVTDTYFDLTQPTLDYFHINAVDVAPDGNLLVSGRHISALLKVRKSTGEVMWTFGGKRSSFPLVGDAGPSFPHDVRSQPDGTISFFDNGVTRVPPVSRAVSWKLNEQTFKATPTQVLRQTPDVYTAIQGSNRLLPNGSRFTSWGTDGSAVEFQGSTVVFDSVYADPAIYSYRAYKTTWTGQPGDMPQLSAYRSGATVTVAASWNGATQVAKWQLRAGPSAGSLRTVGTVSKQGFDTVLQATVAADDIVFAVQALNSDGNPLGGSSATVAAAGPVPSAWTSAGGSTLQVAPSATTKSLVGPTFVGVTGSDRQIYIKNPSSSAPWTPASGLSVYSPGLGLAGTGPLNLAVTGLDGQLYVRDANNSKAGYTNLGGYLTSGPSLTTGPDDRVDVYGRGGDNQIWHRTRTAGAWGGWERVGGVSIGGVGVTTSGSGTVDLVVSGSDLAVWQAHRDNDTSPWRWTRLGGRSVYQPAIATLPDGRLAVFATGSVDGGLWKTQVDGTKWSAWTSLGGAASAGPTAVARPDGLSNVFVRAPDSSVWGIVG